MTSQQKEALDILRRVREGPPLTDAERRKHHRLLAFAAEVEKALQQQPWWREFLKATAPPEKP